MTNLPETSSPDWWWELNPDPCFIPWYLLELCDDAGDTAAALGAVGGGGGAGVDLGAVGGGTLAAVTGGDAGGLCWRESENRSKTGLEHMFSSTLLYQMYI